MNEIRLFVDDIRCPDYFGLAGWTVVKNSRDAIQTLQQGNVVECSLDHDLGGQDTGYKVVCWMEEHNVWPRDGVFCHSANPVGKSKIQSVIDRHARQIHEI